jgi:hypothetical protein
MQFQWGLKESTEELKTEVAAIEEVLEVFKADADLVDNRAANPGGPGGATRPPDRASGTIRPIEPSGGRPPWPPALIGLIGPDGSIGFLPTSR